MRFNHPRTGVPEACLTLATTYPGAHGCSSSGAWHGRRAWYQKWRGCSRRSSRGALPVLARPGMRLRELKAEAMQGERSAVSPRTCALRSALGLGLSGLEQGGSNPLLVRHYRASYNGNPRAGPWPMQVPSPCRLARSPLAFLGQSTGRRPGWSTSSPRRPGAESTGGPQPHQLCASPSSSHEEA